MPEVKVPLEDKALEIRQKFLKMVVAANKGHMGGALSCADLLVALYYGGLLRFKPEDPQWSERDRFILSKGHSCEVLYCILGDLGFFPFSQVESYQKPGGLLSGHPTRSIPGIEIDTGSLGHGLGVGSGLALAAKMDQKEYKTVVLLSDGECCEGSTWEAALFAPRHQLHNLIAIIDKNDLCVTDALKDCIELDPLADKWRACGWDVQEIDGHSFNDIQKAFEYHQTRSVQKPLAIIANTIKGKGISFMERSLGWHHGTPKGEQLEQARRDLFDE